SLTSDIGLRGPNFLASYSSSFFFFQAEDGIRDRNVTGVQTCALPIWADIRRREPEVYIFDGDWQLVSRCLGFYEASFEWKLNGRSEERRVGKECKLRWEQYY